MPIQVLPTHLVNKIAAGEVIERPASVVKELVENSLDAGATSIAVAVEDGGKRLISVTDNGGGMSAEDLALAFAPHATSKLAGEDDLFDIRTMGFRGEALASIASVSHAHIRTCRRGDAGGNEIHASGETIDSVRPCAAAPGTTITIGDLFFNTPARRKFLRAASTELGQISEQMTRLSLPHPQVAMRLTHNGRQVMNLPAVASTLLRAGDVLGQEVAQTLMAIVNRRGAIGVAGLIGQPRAARATAQWQYCFLNGRYIRDRVLGHAVREAYRGVIEPNRWPVAIVFLTVDPAEVDVNVHPTKIEVRFRDGQAVHSEVLAALRETLNKSNLSPAMQLERELGLDSPDAGKPGATDEVGALPAPSVAAADLSRDSEPVSPGEENRRQSLRQALADFFKSVPPIQPRLSFPDAPARSADGGGREDFTAAPTPMYRPAAVGEPAPSPDAASPMASNVASSMAESTPAAMQIHNSYIVAACEDGMIVVDQHALHERLIYNDLKRRLAQGNLAGQRMLIPQSVALPPAAVAAVMAQSAMLERLGVELAPFGPSALAVQCFPTMLTERGVEASEFVRELADKLLEDPSADGERMLEDVLSMLACKAAVRAGDPLSMDEMTSLLARRGDAEKSSSCPHGRPTTLKLTLKDLQKQFHRT